DAGARCVVGCAAGHMERPTYIYASSVSRRDRRRSRRRTAWRRLLPARRAAYARTGSGSGSALETVR
ncbi:MAG TPA: hypothetical protein VIL49_04255, partial [Capillimicrobium sp.]